MAEERCCPGDLSMWGEKKTSVPEVRAFLDALDAPDRMFRVIHVTEISDKGSIYAYLTKALRRAGYRVGTFASPHLVDIWECILIDEKVVSSEVFRAAAEAVKCQGETEVRAGRNSPACFECLYYMAMLLFRETSYEVVVPETGLSGGLDAANSRAPCLTVLISISLDHMQYLGDAVERIAAEKAGIIKKKVPVIYLDAVPSVADITAAKAREMQLLTYPAASDRTGTCSAFLSAPYQQENAALATKTFQVFSEDETGDAQRRMAVVSFPEAIHATVRMACTQRVHPDVFLDDAHNVDGVLRMAEVGVTLAAKCGKKPLLLTSSMQDKELATTTETFAKASHPARIYLVPLHTSRRTEMYTLAGIYHNEGTAAAKTYESVRKALQRARGEQAEDTILFVAGSPYLIGRILAEESK